MANRPAMEGVNTKKTTVPPSSQSAKRTGKMVLVTPSAKTPTLEGHGMSVRESSILNELRKELDTLKEVAKRVKTEGVKDGIDKISTLLNQLVDIRSVIKSGGRQQETTIAAQQGGNASITADASRAPEQVVSFLEEIKTMNHRMAEQGEMIRALAASVSHSSGKAVLEDLRDATGNDARQTTAWTEVVKRTRRTKTQPNTAQPERKDLQMGPADKPRARTRPPAIMVEVAPDKYAEVAMKIRNETDLGGTGGRVVGIRQARRGGIIIEVRGDGTQVEAVRAEVSKAAGHDAVVNTIYNKIMIEIRDMDEWTQADEIQDAIVKATEFGKEAITVLNVRKQYNGTQAALVLVPARAARHLLSDRLKIGMVYCRVRERERRERCYRCLAYGHEGRTCSGTDRSACCRRCGGPEHFAKNCTAPREEAEVFAKVLKSESAIPRVNNEAHLVES